MTFVTAGTLDQKKNVRTAGGAPPEEPRGVPNLPLTDEEKAQINARINQLEVEHGDLDDVIERLAGHPAQDQLQLRRLKKRKLVLKDQIEHLRALLVPDIPA